MENNNQDQAKPEQAKPVENNSNKPQRKLKFKTLDGKMIDLVCDYDIKIIDLKKKLAEIYKIEPIRQRLLNKGKQFKDDETLDKLVEKDDTIIHLVFRSESDVKAAQENATNNTQTNTAQNRPNVINQGQNGNSFQNIISMLCNSDEIRNLTNNVVSSLLGNNNQNSQNPHNNQNNAQNTTNTNTTTNRTINLGNTQYHSINLSESLNLVNSPLHPASQSPNTITPPPLNLNNPSSSIPHPPSQNQNAGVPPVNPNNYSSQFPIKTSERDKKYDIHLKKIEEELNATDEIISNRIEPRIPLPLLNTTQNVFTAISRQIRKYVIVNQNMLCHLMRLADLMEREQFITDSETRMVGNKLLDQAYKALAHTSKASQDLSNVIKSSNFNTAPNMGYIGVVCQEIGLQSTSIPINMGELNLNAGDLNLNLENLINAGNNNSNANSNNNNPMNNLGNIVLRAFGNRNQPGQGNAGQIAANIPINVDVNIEATGDNINPNTTNTHQTITINAQNNNNDNNTTTTTSNVNQEKKEEKKENIPEQKDNKEQKQPEKVENKPQTQTQTNTNTNNINNTRPTNVQNQAQNPTANINFGSLLGNMMGSILGNPNQNANNNNNSSNSNPMGMFGGLLQNLMGSLGEDSDDEAPQQQTSNKNENIIQPTDYRAKKGIRDELIHKLVNSPQLRKETKLNDKEKLGVQIEPNIEFSSVSNEIISNLTVQDVYDMYNLKFKGLSRLRKEIKEKYFKEKEKNDEVIKKVVEILCERFILMENQIDKIKPNKEFNMEEFFNKHLKLIFNLFISDELMNKTDDEWEEQLHKLIINMLIELIEQLKDIYETGEDGAKFFFESNILCLIENLVGQKFLEKIQKYDEDIITNFVENVFIIIKTEKIKEEENKKEDKKENENIERPTLLTVDEIFKIAMKDKERLEKEEKEQSENNDEDQDKKKYSDFYYMTSLFKK